MNNSNNIGIDPSMVETIETLDVPSTDPTPSKKDNQKNSVLKKVLFTLLILILMGGVAYLVFYYLRLGTNHANEKTKSINLKDISIYEGETLSNDISSYGIFEGVNVNDCILNINNVNSYVAGEYVYSITCNELQKEAKVVVNKLLNVKTQLISKVVGDSLTAIELVNTMEDNVSFKDDFNYEEIMAKQGGPYEVDLSVNGNDYMGYVIVYDNKPFLNLKCTSEDGTIEDRIAFDKNRTMIGPVIRINIKTYLSNDEFLEAVNTNQGKMYLLDTQNRIIELIENVNSETLNNEYGSTFPTEYTKIKEYYKDTKKYNCSI